MTVKHVPPTKPSIRDDVQIASSITCGCCEHSVHILMKDREVEIFATATMNPETAIAFARSIIETAELVKAGAGGMQGASRQ